MDWIQILGLAAGVCTSMSMLPQLIKTVKEKKAEDVSLKMLITLIIGVALWTAYGIFKSDLPIILTNALSFLLNSTMIFLRLKYNK